MQKLFFFCFFLIKLSYFLFKLTQSSSPNMTCCLWPIGIYLACWLLLSSSMWMIRWLLLDNSCTVCNSLGWAISPSGRPKGWGPWETLGWGCIMEQITGLDPSRPLSIPSKLDLGLQRSDQDSTLKMHKYVPSILLKNILLLLPQFRC